MFAQIVLGLIGISSGFIVAGGVIALLVGLGIITRYAALTKTAGQVRIYETGILFGGIFGNLLTIYGIKVPLGSVGVGVMGLCFGIYVGSWILALADIVNIFPVFSRRIGMTKGMSIVIITIAAGKVIGSLLHFYYGR